MRTLEEIHERYAGKDCISGTDKNSVHSYLPLYAELLAPYRETDGNVLEIGLMSGASLRMWEEYFHNAEVYGMDLCDQPHGGLADLRPMLAEHTHNIMLGNAADHDTVDKLLRAVRFDVIIEDAGHDLESQLAIYANFRNRMSRGGIYIIEDVADIDATREHFEQIDPFRRVDVIDLRHVKGRFDDVLVVIR